MSILLTLIGIPLLYFGGEILVKYSSRLALALGLSPLVIGLTIVAFGTSSPELLATLISAFKDAPDVAMGNIVGSNITNIGLILGISAMIQPFRARSKVIRREIPVMIFAGVILIPFSWDLTISRLEGAFLFASLVAYLFYLLKSDGDAIADEVLDEITDGDVANEDEFMREYGHDRASGWKPVFGVVVGIALLVLGAQSLVTGAIDLAREFGLTERVIGVTLVAFSTSLPELASSLVASFKKEADILLGNIVGSNIFNALGILGITSMVNPVNMSADVQFDLYIAIAFSVLVLPFLLSSLTMERWEGGILVVLYVVYVGSLFVF
ncbi:MAG: calcium/sodium antiporter [Thainema sp.]